MWGLRNYRTYMQVVNRCLKDDGLFLLHTIGSNTSVRSVDPWLAKYIFPNSMLPSARQITEAAEGIFILEDWHSFGPHYDPTLIAWHRNFIDNWRCIQDPYDQRFQRMWVYYLLSCAGSFRARRNQLWQIVFSKIGDSGNECQALTHIFLVPIVSDRWIWKSFLIKHLQAFLPVISIVNSTTINSRLVCRP